MTIADTLVRRLESISRKMSENRDREVRCLLATFFTNPNLKVDAARAFEESCEALGLVGMSSRNVSIRVEGERIIIASVKAAGAEDVIDVSVVDPLSSAVCKEKDRNV